MIVTLPHSADLILTEKPLIMAILNRTEDSFYAGSRVSELAALEKAIQAVEDGADILDIGGESTRPGALPVPYEQEFERVIPLLKAIRKESSIPISIDTRKSGIASAALDEGADIINDISALEDDPDMAAVCASKNAAVVLMHKKGTPVDMQENPFYDDVVAEVSLYLNQAAERALQAGIPAERIILDPGIGFGKRLQDNIDLLAHLAEIAASGYPVLVGLSRKSFIGTLTGRDPEGRLAGTIAANAMAILGACRILRVHDVQECADLIHVMYPILNEQKRV